MQRVEESNSMGTRQRSGKKMLSAKEEDFAGIEDVLSSGAEDDALSDGETPQPVRRPHSRGTRDTPKETPLMEGGETNLRVLGFSKKQRAQFLNIMMRFGAGKYDWAEFLPRLKQKTLEEIEDYGTLFLSHISEEATDSPTFSDGVPKEGLDVEDVLLRIATMSLIREKVESLSEGSVLFADDIVARYPGLVGGRYWKEQHDRVLLKAIMKYGYGSWQAIVDDKDSGLQEVIFQELNLAYVNTPPSVAPQPQIHPPGTSRQAQTPAMWRRLAKFIKKRVLLLQDALIKEYQKIYPADEEMNDIPDDEAGRNVHVAVEIEKKTGR